MESLNITDIPLPQCETESAYNGHNGLRILSIFIIFIASALGVFFPILSSKYSFVRLPQICFFVAKFFGSGVIIATAFIHLLEPASEALGDECLGGTFEEYPWAFGICLMSLFALFISELLTDYYVDRMSEKCEFGRSRAVVAAADDCTTNVKDGVGVSVSVADDIGTDPKEINIASKETYNENSNVDSEVDLEANGNVCISDNYSNDGSSSISGSPQNEANRDGGGAEGGVEVLATMTSQESACDTCLESYRNQIIAVSILEFGILFHSVFIGLTLAVSGDEFPTLFVVLVFHQMFEGLGLGTRVAEVEWPKSKRFTPWLMGIAFSVTVPISIAIGLGVRQTFIPGSRKALISSGVFDSISAGILIYTGLVELMAREFLFSEEFKGPDGLRRMLAAYFIMCVGAALMALLGKWA